MRIVEGIASVGDVGTFVAELEGIGDAHDVTVQAFDARYVVGREHVARAVEFADRARERDEAIARERGVEILLYAAGRRQINRALEMGVSEGECPVVVVVDSVERSSTGSRPQADDGPGDETRAAEDVADLLEDEQTLGEYDPERVRSFFDVSSAELEATDAGLEALVLERVALLEVEK